MYQNVYMIYIHNNSVLEYSTHCKSKCHVLLGTLMVAKEIAEVHATVKKLT